MDGEPGGARRAPAVPHSAARRYPGPVLRRGPAELVRGDQAAGRAALDPSGDLARGEILRKRLATLVASVAQSRIRLAALLADIAATEERVAQVHEELAGRNQRKAEHYLRTAAEARRSAARARSIVREYELERPGPG